MQTVTYCVLTLYRLPDTGYVVTSNERHYRPIFPYQKSPPAIARNSAICPVIICPEYFRLDIFFTIFFFFLGVGPLPPQIPHNLVVESLSRWIQLLSRCPPRQPSLYFSLLLHLSSGLSLLLTVLRLAKDYRPLTQFPEQSPRLIVPDLPSRLVSYPEPSIVMVNTLRDCSGHPNR